MDPNRFRTVGVEPTLFLYMLAFMTTSVIEQDLYLEKACRVELKFPDEVCDNIKDKKYSNYTYRVQEVVADFKLYENIVSSVIPIFLAFFLGSWSDKVGRKIPLLLGLLGNFVFSCMIVMAALNDDWGLQPILWGAFLPCSLTGGNLTVFMSAFSYLSDTTSQKSRTFRVTILEAAYLIPMPVGVFIGALLFQWLNRSYAAMFAINALLLFLAILYSIFFLSWKTAPDHQPSFHSCLFGLLDWGHVSDSLGTLFKERPDSRRRYLFLVLFSMALYTVQREESSMVFYFTQLKFEWGVTSYSIFRTAQSSFYIAGLLLGAPLFGKIFGVPETLTIMVGALSHMTARAFFIISRTPVLFYVGAGLGLLGPIVAPILRSIVSKLVPPSERGKIFAMFTVADTSVPLISGTVYAKVYKYTLKSFPEALFLVTIVAMMIVFLIGMYIHVAMNGRSFQQATDSTRETEGLNSGSVDSDVT